MTYTVDRVVFLPQFKHSWTKLKHLMKLTFLKLDAVFSFRFPWGPGEIQVVLVLHTICDVRVYVGRKRQFAVKTYGGV